MRFVALGLLAFLSACSCEKEEPVFTLPDARRVLLDRILISYRGNPLGIKARRSYEDARAVAERVYKRAMDGEDFVQLRQSFSDDRAANGGGANGPYILLNDGLKPAPTLPHVPRMLRKAMGKRLGDIALRMDKGDIALIRCDPEDYPAGWEVIRCAMRDDRTDEEVERDLGKTNVPPKDDATGKD